MDVSLETGKEATSEISAALNVTFLVCWDVFPLLWIPQDRAWLWLFPAAAAAITIPYDTPAPAFWHYSVHLFLQAGAPAQTLPSSKCSVRGGSARREQPERSGSSSRPCSTWGRETAQVQAPGAHHTVGRLHLAAWAEPRRALRVGSWLWHSEDELVRGMWAFQV